MVLACHSPSICLLISPFSFACATLSFIAPLNQSRQGNSQWRVATVMAAHTWEAIAATASPRLLGSDILLITFHSELMILCVWSFAWSFMYDALWDFNRIHKEAFNSWIWHTDTEASLLYFFLFFWMKLQEVRTQSHQTSVMLIWSDYRWPNSMVLYLKCLKCDLNEVVAE